MNIKAKDSQIKGDKALATTGRRPVEPKEMNEFLKHEFDKLKVQHHGPHPEHASKRGTEPERTVHPREDHYTHHTAGGVQGMRGK